MDKPEKNIDLAPDVKGGEMPLSDYELYDKQIERSADIADHYERVKKNIEEEITSALDLLNPYYRTQYKEKLNLFADRLEEIADMARELATKF